MPNLISLSQAFIDWTNTLDECGIDRNDGPAMSEWWNSYTDSLCKDGYLCALQYHYAPAYDDEMPGNGSRWDALSDDREFILEAMGVTMTAAFVPFSQSRSKAEKQPSLNWVVTLKKDGREFITTDYMQGCGHCPADKKTFNTPAYNPATAKRAAVAKECETGREVKTFVNLGYMGMGKAISPPGIADVMHSLLSDARALDCRDFADWCADFGCDTDSIKARATFDACIEIAMKLRGAFGAKTVDELNELFQDM